MAADRAGQPGVGRAVALLVLYGLTALVTLFVFVVKQPGLAGTPDRGFESMLSGTASRPFVYRQLVPATICAISRATPDEVKRRCQAAAGNPKRKAMFDYLGWRSEHLFEYFVAVALIFGCYLGFAYALRRLAGRLFRYPSFVADLLPIPSLILLTQFMRAGAYLYDPGTLLLFTWSVAFIVDRARLPFYLAFLLATLNKETSILLVPLFVAAEYRTLPRRRLVAHAGLQLAAFVAIKLWLALRFQGNPGGFVEFHLFDHNLVLHREPVYLIHLLLVAAMFTPLVVAGWAEKPPFLRRGLAVTLVPLLVLTAFLGYLDELRDYYEALPFLILLSLPTLVRLLSDPDRAAGAAEDPERPAPRAPSG